MITMPELFQEYLTVSEIKRYCEDISSWCISEVKYHYWHTYRDKNNDVVRRKIGGDKDISTLRALEDYNLDQIKFGLTSANKVAESGICGYIKDKGELVFNLKIKGVCVIFVAEFEPIKLEFKDADPYENFSEELRLLIVDEFLSKENKSLLIIK